jgi:NAD(P)-dependent dehydrogenase (short-subunit alcohol dehydrogenase family)
MNEKPVVLISGCSSGIGNALTKEFAARGYHVIATARKPESIKGLKSEVVDILQLDVIKEKSIGKCVRDVMRKHGRIDILVNNAGYALIGPAMELDIDAMRQQFEANLFGLAALSQAVVQHMVKAKKGMIVNMSSVSGVLATPFAGAYCASKAALNLFSDSMRMECAPFGIGVVTIQPGAIRSNFGRTAAKNISKYNKSLYAPIADSIEDRAYISQKNPTPAEIFARILVLKLMKKNPPRVIRIGNDSSILPFLAKLPLSFTDRIFRKRFGLNKM